MAVYNNGLPFTNAGALQVTLGSESPPAHVKRGGYSIAVDPIAEMAYIADAGLAVPSSAVIHGGLALTPAGSLYVTQLTTGMSYHVHGFRVRKDGAVLITPATDASDTYNGGWACALASGARSVVGTGADGLTFAVDFNDLGAGEVNTEAVLGGVSPTFTRATAATTVLSTGLVASVATGVPRSYYDPTSLTYLGYLAEGARTNLCLQSETFDSATWTKITATISSNAAASPDGTITADKLIPNNGGTGRVEQAQTITAGQTYTFSVFAKTVEQDSVFLRCTDNAGGLGSATVTYNTTTGAVEIAATTTGTWTSASSTAKAYPNGWWRFTLTFTATTNAGDLCQVRAGDSGDGTSGFLIWGAQLEQAAFASSYIPTTTLAVARNADVLTYPTTGWLNAAAGTVMAQAQVSNVSANFFLTAIDDGTLNERFHMFVSGTAVAFRVVDGGVATNPGNVGTLAANTTFKTALAWAVGTGQTIGAANGALGTAADPAGMPTVTTARIGVDQAGALQAFGPIRRVAYFNSRLPNAVLQALTA